MRIKLGIALALAVAACSAAPASAATDAVPSSNCVDVLQGGDMGERFCVNDAECVVSHYHTTFLGTERTCVVRRPAGTRSASVDAGRCVATYVVTGKYGSKWCVDTEGQCLVYSYETTIFGTAYYCRVRRP